MRRPTRYHLIARLVLAVVAISIWGCASDDSPTSPSDFADGGALALGIELQLPTTSTILAKDEAGGNFVELEALSLSFDSIRAYPTGTGGGEGMGSGHRDADGAYIELLLDPITLDLMELEEGLTQLLVESKLPEGAYSHLALHILEAMATTAAGEQLPAVLPEHHDGLLRILTHFVVEEGQITGLTIVIDLDATLRDCTLEDGVLVLRPVLWGEDAPEGPCGWQGHDDCDGEGHQGDGDGHHGDGDCEGEGDGDGDGHHGDGDCEGEDCDGDGDGDGDGHHGDGDGDCDGDGDGENGDGDGDHGGGMH